MKSLFDSYQLGPLKLKNRIVMAPLTRSRAGEGEAPRRLNVEYYQQRASAGLIISEASQISQRGQGYLWTPGIFTPQQVDGWREVRSAVGAAGGTIFVQLWHVGRISHTSLQPDGDAPISSTDIAGEKSTCSVIDESGKRANVPTSKPRIASIKELKEVVEEYRQAAVHAKAAGFDGVEIHGANGYLLDQFLNSMVNKRDDQYGNQNKENRTRLLLEAFDAIAEVFGAELVGVRIAPYGSFNSMPQDAKVEETFLFLANELSRRNAAYVHLVLGHPKRVVPDEFLPKLRGAFHGTIMVNGGLTKETAQALLDEDKADLFAFGRLFIANPDLPERFKNDWPLAEPDPQTFYGGDAEGYTDYPEFAG